MNFRVTDNNSTLSSRINTQRSRLNILQERISTGKRINRPSDDPGGAEMVLNLRTSLKEIEQFGRSAQTANHKLTAADDALSGFENLVERVRTLVAQGLSDTTTQEARNSLATEIESLRERILNLANSKYGDEYLFGGTRQNAPPFDPTTAAPNATPAVPQHIQIEPGANAIAAGVTAETIFSDAASTIFTDLTNAANALRGTGDTNVDRVTLQNTMTRLGIYADLATVAHARVGANMNSSELALERLTSVSLSLEERAASIENADFAETALALADTERSLEATLQVAGRGRRSLFDYLG